MSAASFGVYLRLGVSGMVIAGVTTSFCCSPFTLDLAVHVYMQRAWPDVCYISHKAAGTSTKHFESLSSLFSTQPCYLGDCHRAWDIVTWRNRLKVTSLSPSTCSFCNEISRFNDIHTKRKCYPAHQHLVATSLSCTWPHNPSSWQGMTHNSCNTRFSLVAHYTRAPIYDTVSQHNHVPSYVLRVADPLANALLTTPATRIQHHSTITDTLEHSFGVAAKRVNSQPRHNLTTVSPTFRRWAAPRAPDPVTPPCNRRVPA
jgi:hypothetical protein